MLLVNVGEGNLGMSPGRLSNDSILVFIHFSYFSVEAFIIKVFSEKPPNHISLSNTAKSLDSS
jgi:hypothetical protein